MEDRFKFRVYYDGKIKEVLRLYHNGEVGLQNGLQLGKFDFLILMQCTGLKDENGTLIFEGDVVRRSSTFERHEVKFEDGMFFAGYHHGSSTSKKKKAIQSKMVVVLGNIHENPELLNNAEGGVQ